MISTQMIQDCIDDLHEIMRARLGVFTPDGSVVASQLEDTAPAKTLLAGFLESPADSQQMKGYHFFKLYDGDETAYVVAAENHADGYHAGRLAVSQIGRLLELCKEKSDTNQFIQNVLLDVLAPADIYNQSKLLNVKMAVPRMVFLVETQEGQDETVLAVVRALYGCSSRDFVTAMDEKTVILVRELKEEDQETEILHTANMLVDMINAETMQKAHVSYGNYAEELKDLPRAYHEAKVASEVGRIFYSDKNVTAYSMLGIGRLIYQLPVPMCDMFLQEVFGEERVQLDEETLTTINTFFDLNLNLSETARQLFVHRNTLAYRLEKIQKLTGLDIRSFEDAMTLKLALMVAEYRRISGEILS